MVHLAEKSSSIKIYLHVSAMQNRVMRMAATSSESESALRVFVSYSHKDEEFRRDIETALSFFKREGLVTVWTDRRILPGDKWEPSISEHLDCADIVLFLISADFAASDYCWDIEMVRALELSAMGSISVIPVIVRPVEGWSKSPLGRFQALPTNGRPITEANNRDEALADVARGIKKLIMERKLSINSTRRVEWRLDVEGKLSDFPESRVRDISRELRRLTGEIEIVSRGIKEGSVQLLFSSPVEAFEKIKESFATGALAERIKLMVSGIHQTYGATISISSRVIADESTPSKECDLPHKALDQPTPPSVKGMILKGGNPFKLQFNLEENANLAAKEENDLKDLLLRYMHTFMVVPGDDMHVDLSPFAEGCGVPEKLRPTELGLALLEQDLDLKKFTAALLHPATHPGGRFWTELRSANVDDADLTSCIRVWIVPDSASVFEKMVGEDGLVTIEGMSLKLLSDFDYATQKKLELRPTNSAQNETALRVFRDVIFPIVEREVNTGPTFGRLRQIQSIMVFSAWLRRRVGEELVKRGYMDSGDTNKFGLNRITTEPLRIQEEYQSLVRDGAWRWAETTNRGGKLVTRRFVGGRISFTNVLRGLQ